jgi:hypothetical protein
VVRHLAKSSFEETIEQLLHAGVYGKIDNMDGVSANIMMGQIAPAGTGVPEFLLDEKMMVEEMKKRPAKQKIEKMSDQEVVNKYMNITEFCQEGVGINFDIDNIPDENIKLSSCGHMPGISGDHAPMHYAQLENDIPLYIDKYRKIPDLIIDVDNWRCHSTKWSWKLPFASTFSSSFCLFQFSFA